MPVAVGPYGQSQPSCFDRVKMGFVMGCAVGMAAGALFGTFSCLRLESSVLESTSSDSTSPVAPTRSVTLGKLSLRFLTYRMRIGMRGRELMGGIGKTMMQSGGTFGTFMAIGMGIRC
ncbi:reactive oxygen species modulator 1 isoform X1 [Desmodus rotundus]|uniref:reactive oxygen species modulator 1 isoform X1 n=1 Tax=Desmodus rotundus TaxID=9430 RepID=UPI001E1BEBBC|nr:reactive oxygen species modulator 1 isoform X1 [Desmodus rotundus]